MRAGDLVDEGSKAGIGALERLDRHGRGELRQLSELLGLVGGEAGDGCGEGGAVEQTERLLGLVQDGLDAVHAAGLVGSHLDALARLVGHPAVDAALACEGAAT